MNHDEMFFEVSEAPEGEHDARALGHGSSQGEDRDHLKDKDTVRDAVGCHFASPAMMFPV